MSLSVGIIGHGAFGAFLEVLARRFLTGATVRVSSSRHAPDGARFFSLADTCASDVVILSVPISAFEENVARVLPLVPQSSVIVDVATVKAHTVDVLHRLAPGRRYIATHPMFGPESYAKLGEQVTGLRVVLAENTLAKAEYEKAKAFLRDTGFAVVEMSADEHDKRLAETLFLTHFVGQMVARAGFVRTDIDTVSFGFLMQAVESVKHDTALFADVFRHNPYCAAVLDRLEGAEHEVRDILETPRKS
jgi:prephenate dehydrogenase